MTRPVSNPELCPKSPNAEHEVTRLPDNTYLCGWCGGSFEGVDDEKKPPTMAEMRQRWQEHHLCLRCGHQGVCMISAAAQQRPELYIIIAQCVAHEPDGQ